MSDTDRRLASPEHRAQVSWVADNWTRAANAWESADEMVNDAESFAADPSLSATLRAVAADVAILLRRRADTLAGV